MYPPTSTSTINTTTSGRDDTTALHDDGRCFLGLDVGTQGTKGVLYHPASGKVVGRHAVSYGLLPTEVAGRAEQDPRVWCDAVLEVLTALSWNTTRYRLSGVGVSGQQHGLVALDASLNVLRPAKLWCDVEAEEEARSFSTRAGLVMGRPWIVPAGFTVPKVLWMQRHEPENYRKMAHCVLPHDYVTAVLCGTIPTSTATTTTAATSTNNTTHTRLTTDAGDASGTGVFDPSTRSFSRALAALVDDRFYATLPDVLEPTATAGTLAADFFPHDVPYYPVPISAGSGDNMCSALGVGCVRPGTAVLSLGTSGTVFNVEETPVVDHDGTTAAFCDATGRHLPLSCVMSCTGVLEDVVRSCASTHAAATRAALSVPPGCHGLSLLPYLRGERTPPWPHAQGALLGLTPANLRYLADVGVLYRAALEGVAYALKQALEGRTVTDLLVVGGGSRNRLWRRILADVLEVTLRFPLEAESAALGAALQAGAAVAVREGRATGVEDYVSRQPLETEHGVVEPDRTASVTVATYRAGYARFRDGSQRLFAP